MFDADNKTTLKRCKKNLLLTSLDSNQNQSKTLNFCQNIGRRINQQKHRSFDYFYKNHLTMSVCNSWHIHNYALETLIIFAKNYHVPFWCT